jgi:hypothetical protein
MLNRMTVRVEVVRNANTRRAKLVGIYMVDVTPCTPRTTLRDCLAVACEQVKGFKGVRANDQLCAFEAR